jgi:hypothetical protein
MRILIVFDSGLFKSGPADVAAEKLADKLISQKHEVEILRIPLPKTGSHEFIKQMMLVKGIEITNVDKVIALTFPACLINHPNKSIWLIQPFQIEGFEEGFREGNAVASVADQQVMTAFQLAYQSIHKDVAASTSGEWDALIEKLPL